MRVDDESLAKFFQGWPKELAETTRALLLARKALEDAGVGLARVSTEVGDVTGSGFGTEDLEPALAALRYLFAADMYALHELDDVARRVSAAFTATPLELIASGKGVQALELGGTVMVLRGALREIDQAQEAAHGASGSDQMM
jgi:hypothetical protein